VVNDIDHDRRRFLRTAAIAMAGAQLGMIGSAQARGTNISFGPLKQIDAGLLSVAYAEAGAANGRPVILLHGRPYDIHSYVDVAPVLASAGYRVIVPYLRGYGATRFLSSERSAGHHGADDHHCERFRRRERRRASLRQAVRGQILASDPEGDRPQRAPGSSGGVRQGHRRRRPVSIVTNRRLRPSQWHECCQPWDEHGTPAAGTGGAMPRLRDVLRRCRRSVSRVRQPDVGARGPVSQPSTVTPSRRLRRTPRRSVT
jgi:hypothetical protein